MSEAISYAAPRDQVISLSPRIRRGARKEVARFTTVAARPMSRAPAIAGVERLPARPRSRLVASNYRRRGPLEPATRTFA